MKYFPFWIAWILGTGLAFGGPAESQTARLWAVVPQVDDGVKVETGTGERTPRLLVRWEILAEGSKIRVPQGKSVALMCSTDRWVELQGKADWILNAAACVEGQMAYPGAFQELSPSRGRIPGVDATMALGRPTRGNDELVVLLSPRRTAVAEARPEIRWLGHEGASEYEIDISDPPHGAVRIASRDAVCAADPAWGGDLVCSYPWPESHPGLSAGKTYGLRVGYRIRITSPLKADKDRRRLVRLGEAEARQLGKDLDRLDRLDDTARLLLSGGVYARNGLYADAIAAYQQMIDPHAAGPLQVTLADLYLEVGLVTRAVKGYEAAYKGSRQHAVQAAAAFGLGRCRYEWKEYDKALPYFQEARDAFRELGFKQEADAAGAAVRKVAGGGG
jgi:hypothetical protein